MNSIARNIALTAILALTAIGGTAQSLNTEVEIRYNETPQLRDFNKIALTPAISVPKASTILPPYSYTDVRVGVPGSITTLEAASYADSIYTSPWRGYATLGFMPKFNLGASAGYKFLDNDHTRLNAWLQYDGTAYEGRPMENATPAYNRDRYIRRNTATVGAALHQAVGRESFIDAGVDYSFSRFNTPTAYDLTNQNLHRVNASMLWTLIHNDITYGLGAAFSRFAPTNSLRYKCLDTPDHAHYLQPTRENRYDAYGFFRGHIAGASSAGIDLRLSHLNYNHSADVIHNSMELDHGGETHHTLLSIAPRYCFDVKSFHLDLGVNIDLTFGAGKVFHIAPDAKATWLPSDLVKVYISATGGQHQNTLGSLHDITPYALPFQTFRNSQVVADAEAGVTVGSWKGFYAEIAFNYGIANDWLMPYTFSEQLTTTFTALDIRGYRLHGKLGYSYRDLFAISASYEMAPQKLKRGYYLWADRAKRVIDINFTITPFSPLDINLGWEYRGGRATTAAVIIDGGGHPVPSTLLRPLRSVNNLKAGALYRITPQWSAFITGENLLNRHHYLIGGMPAQGITGLIGATYKF